MGQPVVSVKQRRMQWQRPVRIETIICSWIFIKSQTERKKNEKKNQRKDVEWNEKHNDRINNGCSGEQNDAKTISPINKFITLTLKIYI